MNRRGFFGRMMAGAAAIAAVPAIKAAAAVTETVAAVTPPAPSIDMDAQIRLANEANEARLRPMREAYSARERERARERQVHLHTTAGYDVSDGWYADRHTVYGHQSPSDPVSDGWMYRLTSDVS